MKTAIVLFAVIFCACATTPVPDNTATIREELEAQYQVLAEANARRDLVAVSAMWSDDFTMADKDGKTLTPDEVRGYWQNLYDNSIDPLHFRYTIQALELKGDEVIATVQHQISRMNAIDGELRQVDTSSSQKETWVKDGEVWKLRRISDVKEGERLVDGAPSSRR